MKRLSFIPVLALLMLMAGPASAAEIVHSPILAASAGRTLQISAVLNGAPSGTRIRLFYRIKGKEQFQSTEMLGALSQFDGEIPGEQVQMPGLEYYLEAQQTGVPGPVASFPVLNARLNPAFVIVRKDNLGPEMQILSPMEGDTVDSDTPVITVAFNDEESGIDLASVEVRVDGALVKDKARIQVFETLMSYVPAAALPSGEHEVQVTAKDKAGNPGSLSWAFSVKTPFEGHAKKKKRMHWDGAFSYETQYGAVIQQPTDPHAPLPYRPYGLNRGRVELNGRGVDNTLKLKVNKSDEERSDQQPTDRYLALWQNRQGLIALGDYSPKFSELSLYNPLFLRGVTLDLRSGQLDSGHSRFMAVWGQTQRPVNGGQTGFSGVPGTGAFGQYLYGARWELGGEHVLLGFNTVTVNDDPFGLDPTTMGAMVPKYTWLITSDARINLTPIYLSLSGEGGLDYYWNGPTALGVNLGLATRAGADWNILPWGTRLTVDYKDLGGNFGFLDGVSSGIASVVPGGYTSMANPGLIPDYRGYESSFSQSILGGQASVSFDMNKWRDNLQEIPGRSTVETDYMSGFINLAFGTLPYLSAGMTRNHQVNDADGNTLPALDAVSQTLNLSLGYTKPLNVNTSLSGNIAYVSISYADQAVRRSSQDLTNVQYVASAFLVHDASSFSLSGAMGNLDQPSFGAASSFGGITAAAKTGNNNTVSLRWSEQWKPRVFDSFLNYDLALSHLESPGLDTVPSFASDSNRSTYSAGANYTVRENHRFGVSLAYAMVATEKALGTVKTSDSLAQLMAGASYHFRF